MADRFSDRHPYNQPSVSPYASNSHSRGAGIGRLSHRKAWVVTLPLLAIGATVAVVAANSPAPAHRPDAQSPVTLTQQATPQTSQAASNAPPAITSPGKQSAQSDSSSLNVSVGASNDSGTHTQVTVNGQNVPVPKNGTIHRTVTSPDGSTNSVSVTSTSDGSSSSFSSSTSSVSSTSTSNGGSTSSSGYTVMNGQPIYWSSQ